MACGAKYAYMLRTVDGKTPDDPWNLYAGPTDYDEWYDVAHKVGREVFRRWDWVLEIEKSYAALRDAGKPTPVPGPYPQRDQVLFLLQDFAQQLEQLKHVLVEGTIDLDWTWEPGTRKAIEVATLGTCVLEQLDDAAAYYKKKPLPKPEDQHKPDEPSLGGVLVTLGMLGGAAYYFKTRGRR